MEVENRYVTLKNQLERDEEPKETDFEFKTSTISLASMKKQSSSHKAINFSFALSPGQGIDAYGVGRVVASTNRNFEKDDLVTGLLGWEEYSFIQGEFKLSFRNLKKETVFVSAASGSVGNLVGQYAKLSGRYVVGSAGNKQKVEMLKDKLGFDDAFNYKDEPDLTSTLQRVVVCGVISEDTDGTRRAAPNMMDVIYKRLSIQGFLAADHMKDYAEFTSITSDYIRNAKLHVLKDISIGLESISCAFVGIFRGNNIGKKMVQIVKRT
ncbi:hypothetical protein MKX01_021650 [Papaver californicum]|nr:hypothetical protein MKX01_021650 [Papaver californicum]